MHIKHAKASRVYAKLTRTTVANVQSYLMENNKDNIDMETKI